MQETGGPGGEAPRLGRQVRSIAGRDIAFDKEGFFLDYDDWSEEVARELAAESGLADLAEPHWQVLRYLREYYGYHRRAPLNRELRQGTGLSLLFLKDLFPGGLKNGARRLAGLPNPKSCG